MKRQGNAWYQAVVDQLTTAGGPLTVMQIWRGMEASDFQHRSKAPRATLGGRIAEMVQRGTIVRVGHATYQLVTQPPSTTLAQPQLEAAS